MLLIFGFFKKCERVYDRSPIPVKNWSITCRSWNYARMIDNENVATIFGPFWTVEQLELNCGEAFLPKFMLENWSIGLIIVKFKSLRKSHRFISQVPYVTESSKPNNLWESYACTNLKMISARRRLKFIPIMDPIWILFRSF